MDEQGKIYWHSAHHEALQLELYEYVDSLEFKEEHALSKEALRIDTLAIKKIKDVQISKNIGKIFRKHNIVEYKSEGDYFSFWDYQSDRSHPEVLCCGWLFGLCPESVKPAEWQEWNDLSPYPKSSILGLSPF